MITTQLQYNNFKNQLKTKYKDGDLLHTYFVVRLTGILEVKYIVKITYKTVTIFPQPPKTDNIDTLHKRIKKKIASSGLYWQYNESRLEFYKELTEIEFGLDNMLEKNHNDNNIYDEVTLFVQAVSGDVSQETQWLKTVNPEEVRHYNSLAAELFEFVENQTDNDADEQDVEDTNDNEIEDTVKEKEVKEKPAPVKEKEIKEKSALVNPELLPSMRELLPPLSPKMSNKEKEFTDKYYGKIHNVITHKGFRKDNKLEVITIKAFISYDYVFIKVIIKNTENHVNNDFYTKQMSYINKKITTNLENEFWETVAVNGTYLYMKQISKFKFGLYNLRNPVNNNLILQGIFKFITLACSFTNIHYIREPYEPFINSNEVKEYYTFKKELALEKELGRQIPKAYRQKTSFSAKAKALEDYENSAAYKEYSKKLLEEEFPT